MRRYTLVAALAVVAVVAPMAAAFAADPPPRGAVDGASTGTTALPRLTVRTGEHEGFNRLVFDWPQSVDYKVDRQGERVTLSFTGRAAVDVADIRRRLPALITVVDGGEDGRATRVALVVPATAKLRHFRHGNGVVLDVMPGDAPAPAAMTSIPPPAAPTPNPQPPPPAAPLPVRPAPPAKSAEPASIQPTAAAAAKPVVSANGDEARPTKPTLAFTWQQPAGAAVFRRAGWLWIIFDRTQTIDLASLRKAGEPLIRHLEQIPHPNATVLRLLVPPDHNPLLRRDGLMWLIDFAPQPLRPETPLEVRVEAAEGRLFIPVAEGGGTVKIVDPEVGDTMMVVPVLPLGHGVYPDYEYPTLELPATAQGIVVLPRAGGVSVESARTGIAISRPQGGLHLSAVNQEQAAAVQLGSRPASSPILDIEHWSRGGVERPGRAEIIESIVDGSVERNEARLELARHYAGNGYGAEALGVLRAMVSADFPVGETTSWRAVHGVASFLMHRYPEAAEDFGHESLRGIPEAAAWRAAALAASGDAAAQVGDINGGLGLITSYPERLKTEFGWAALDANLAAGNHQMARIVLDILAAAPPMATGRAKLAYYQGRYHELVGESDEAAAKWAEAESGNDRLYRALASRARVELLLKQRKITRKEAVDALDRLRFAWRDADYEFPLLKRLGELEIDDGDYSGGLRTLKQLLSVYGQHPDIRSVAQTMSDTFAKLYLDGAADTLPPVTAIALYDEFRELTPTGSRGDEMIRRLADRLVAVDLLDRAADLLKHQVEFRLSGLEKARVGAQLAVVRLLDRKPEQAQVALKSSEAPDLPADLQRQRRYLQARAFDDAGRADAGLALLAGDDTATARLLRAEIHWRAQDWPAAAGDFEALVGPTPAEAKLDDLTARFVLHWAAALTLAQDEPGLVKLRKRFGSAMVPTSYGDAFGLLTSGPKTEAIDHKSLAARIQDAEKFQSFMTSYRDRLRAEGLSTIN